MYFEAEQRQFRSKFQGSGSGRVGELSVGRRLDPNQVGAEGVTMLIRQAGGISRAGGPARASLSCRPEVGG